MPDPAVPVAGLISVNYFSRTETCMDLIVFSGVSANRRAVFLRARLSASLDVVEFQ